MVNIIIIIVVIEYLIICAVVSVDVNRQIASTGKLMILYFYTRPTDSLIKPQKT